MNLYCSPNDLWNALRVISGTTDAETVTYEEWDRVIKKSEEKQALRWPVRVEAAAGRATVTGHSRRVGLTTVEIPAEVGRSGAAVIDLGKAGQLAKSAGKKDRAELKVVAGKTELRVGPARITFEIPDHHLPTVVLPDAEPDRPPPGLFAQALTAAAGAAASPVRGGPKQDEFASSRGDFTRVSVFRTASELVVAGTDGTAGAETRLVVPFERPAVGCLIPAAAARVVAAVLRREADRAARANAAPAADVWVTRDSVSVRTPDVTLSTAGAVGQPYRLPAPPPDLRPVRVGLPTFRAAVRAVVAAATDKFAEAVWVQVANGMVVVSGRSSSGRGEAEVGGIGLDPAVAVDPVRLYGRGVLDAIGNRQDGPLMLYLDPLQPQVWFGMDFLTCSLGVMVGDPPPREGNE